MPEMYHRGRVELRSPWRDVPEAYIKEGALTRNQWRICFRWTASGPADVEIVGYH